MKVYIESLLSSWIGWSLVVMAVFVVTATVCLVILNFCHCDRDWVRSQKRLCGRILHLSANLSPSLGLLGTVMGLLQGFMVTNKEELPRMMGLALTTTFVGSLLFVLSYFVLFIGDGLEDDEPVGGHDEDATQ